ncbi:MAG: hypothetical protein ACI39U_04545, partial [Candidatus Cryptobacteroides sp.]
MAAIVAAVVSLDASAQFRTSVSYDELYDSDTVSSLRSHVRNLSAESLEGRPAGSEGEAEAASYMERMLREYGIDVLEFASGNSFGISSGADTLTSCNVVGFIQGSDPKLASRYIVVGARMDNRAPDTYTVDG